MSDEELLSQIKQIVKQALQEVLKETWLVTFTASEPPMYKFVPKE